MSEELAESGLWLGLDTGGTFTDAVLLADGRQVIASAKALTTPWNLAIGISEAIHAVLRRLPAGEERAVHVLALEGDDNQVVIGCVLFDFASGRLRAMAVDPTRQKQGIGVLLVQRLEAELRLEKIGVVSLHARDHAVGFYARLGYAVTGEPFTEVGIPHFNMVKTL